MKKSRNHNDKIGHNRHRLGKELFLVSVVVLHLFHAYVALA